MLGYLARANRFSRSPSHVADYLGTTRGTATQSLKSLNQKGYVTERRSELDKRVVSYDLTDAGQNAIRAPDPLQAALTSIRGTEKDRLQGGLLQDLLLHILDQNKGREFGLCKTCRHHDKRTNGSFCALLNVELTPEEGGDQICHEQVCA